MMNQIQLSDLQVLAAYQFNENGKKNDQLLGLKWVKHQKKWTQKLIEVSRQDVTCWTLFLSFFGKGQLAYISVSLDKICAYLAHYQWQDIKKEALQHKGTLKHKAFLTVCHLANRQLSHRKVQLFKQISNLASGPFKHYWNLAMNGRFLLEQHRYRLPDAQGLQLRFKGSGIPVHLNQKITFQNLAHIEVGYNYELIKEVETDYDSDGEKTSRTIYYYHYPTYPHYQVNTSSQNYLLKRNYL